VRGHLTCSPEQFIVTAPGTQQTSVPGVFAAGRVTCVQYTQAPVAASQGMMAALDAINFLGQAGFNREWSDKLKFQLYDPAQ
jgi:thioredoxin reductase (NADPH)